VMLRLLVITGDLFGGLICHHVSSVRARFNNVAFDPLITATGSYRRIIIGRASMADRRPY
jgi:hypothetical protein